MMSRGMGQNPDGDFEKFIHTLLELSGIDRGEGSALDRGQSHILMYNGDLRPFRDSLTNNDDPPSDGLLFRPGSRFLFRNVSTHALESKTDLFI